MTDDDWPWFREYDRFDTPRSLEPYPAEPAHTFLETAAESHPDQGLHQRGRTVTYPKVLEDAERLATALSRRGVAKGDRVATVLPTSVQFVVATHAISRLGAVHVPNDFLDATEDLVHRLETAAPDVLIGRQTYAELLVTLRDRLEIDHLVLTALDDYAADRDATRPAPSEGGDHAGEHWRDVLAETPPDPPAVDIDVETDVHSVLFTGGTTGTPKGCQLTHRNVVANALQTTRVQPVSEALRGRSAIVFALPMYHAYGYSTLHSFTELAVDMLLVPDARDVDRIRRLVDEHTPLVMLGVPTQFQEVLEAELDYPIVGISGSAPLTSDTKASFDAQAAGLSQGYGLSEMSPVTHFDVAGLQRTLDDAEDDRGYDRPSIGVPLPDTAVKLVDLETDERLPFATAIAEEQEAEMRVDGPQRMQGYLDAEDPFDEDGFVPTGDVVKVDEFGRFYVVDRIKNMINVSGLKVYTEELDDILAELDGVRRPATIGVPDPERPGSERVKIYIEPTPDAALSAADVRSYLDGRIPRYAMPTAIEFVDRIPLTDIGKVDREALRDQHHARRHD